MPWNCQRVLFGSDLAADSSHRLSSRLFNCTPHAHKHAKCIGMGSKFRVGNAWPFRQLASILPRGPRPPSLLDSTFIESADPASNSQSTGALKGKRATTTPALALPDEIWLHVFVTYLAATMPAPPSALDPPLPEAVFPIRYSPARMHAPFLLAAVCRNWRALALGLPELWTYIAVPALRHTPATASYRAVTGRIRRAITRGLNPRWVALVRLLLARSASANIEVVIPCFEADALGDRDGANVAMREEYALHRRIFELLAPHFKRVRTLRAAPQRWIPPMLWTLVGTPPGVGILEAPQLEELVLSTLPNSWWEPESQPAMNLRLEAPRLRICMLQGVIGVQPLPISTALNPPPSPLLRLELSATPDTLESVQSVLGASAVTLEVLHLHMHNRAERAWLALSSPVVLSKLSHLGITVVGSPSRVIIDVFLTLVEIPAAQSVSFDTTWKREEEIVESLVQFLMIANNGALAHLAL